MTMEQGLRRDTPDAGRREEPAVAGGDFTGTARCEDPFWIARLGAALSAAYLTMDRRVLGLFRIYWGLLLLGDLGAHIWAAPRYFSNAGVLSNHFLLYAPISEPTLSLYSAFSTPAEVRLAMGVALVTAYVPYLLGYHTRLANLAVLVLQASLYQRNLMFESGGTVVVILVTLWTLFLPVGDRYSLDALARRGTAREEGSRGPVRSLAVLALLLQVSVIYFFNTIHKTGDTWRQGEAVHLVLWQNRIATPLAELLRMHEPSWLSPLATRGTLIVEGLCAVLPLIPLGLRWTRGLHVTLAVGLHASIALLMSLGPFSYAMIGLNLLLLPPAWVDALERRGARLRWADVVARWGERIAGSLAREPVAVSGWARRGRVVVREAMVAVLMLTATIEVLIGNQGVPPALRVHHQPALLLPLVQYLRIFQNWPMFAPDAPTSDGLVVIDGVTADGRHLDPFTGQEPDFEAPLHGPFHHSQFDCDYHLYIASAHYARYRGEFERWILASHVERGRPQDRIVSFDAYWVSNDAPRAGSTTPTHLERRRFLSRR